MTFRQQLDRWLLATSLSSAQAGALALKAYGFGATGAAAISSLGTPINPLDWKTAGAIFIVGVLWHFNDCLASVPLPAETTNNQTQKI